MSTMDTTMTTTADSTMDPAEVKRLKRNAYMREYRKNHKCKRDTDHAREYNKQYRKKHPDKVRQWNRDFYLRKAAQILAEEAATGEGGDGNA